jgi:hypothetical protein
MKPLCKRVEANYGYGHKNASGDVELSGAVDALDVLGSSTILRTKLETAIALDFSRLLIHHN